jgi:acetyltransferase-like isoleucine patch superfamily enzyme
MQPLQMITRYFPGRLGIKLRKFSLRLQGAVIGEHCRPCFGFFLHAKKYTVEITIGDNVIFGENVFLKMTQGGILEIGDNVKIHKNANFIINKGFLSIGKNSFIGPSVQIINGQYIKEKPKTLLGSMGSTTSDIVIGQNVWIGANCILLKGVQIGNNSIVGAGSVVTKSIPPNVTCAGNPAVLIKDNKWNW